MGVVTDCLDFQASEIKESYIVPCSGTKEVNQEYCEWRESIETEMKSSCSTQLPHLKKCDVYHFSVCPYCAKPIKIVEE